MSTSLRWAWSIGLNWIVASGTEEVFRSGRHEWQNAFVAEYAFVFLVWGVMAALAVAYHVGLACRERRT